MRGIWHMVESILTSVVVISFLLFISNRYLSVIQPEDIADTGYLILQGLDNRGQLRNYTVAKDYLGLNTQIPIYAYNHTIQICDYEDNCVGLVPNTSNTWTANYIIAGNDVYKPFVVKLHMAPLG